MTLITINPFRIFASAASYDSDAQALFDARAAVGDAPAAGYELAISNYILALKAVPGMWAKIIQLVVQAGATTVAGARLSVKGNSLTATALVDADVNPKTGSKGDGSTKNWATGYSGTVSGTAQNDFHTFSYFSETGTGANGMYGNGNTVAGTWNQRKDGSRCSSSSSNAATSASSGIFAMNRSSSANYQRIHGGTLSTVTQASSARAAAAYWLLGTGSSNRQNARVLVWALGPAVADVGDYIAPTNALIAAISAL